MEVLIQGMINRKAQSLQWPGSVLGISFVSGKCPIMRQCNCFYYGSKLCITSAKIIFTLNFYPPLNPVSVFSCSSDNLSWIIFCVLCTGCIKTRISCFYQLCSSVNNGLSIFQSIRIELTTSTPPRPPTRIICKFQKYPLNELLIWKCFNTSYKCYIWILLESKVFLWRVEIKFMPVRVHVGGRKINIKLHILKLILNLGTVGKAFINLNQSFSDIQLNGCLLRLISCSGDSCGIHYVFFAWFGKSESVSYQARHFLARKSHYRHACCLIWTASGDFKMIVYHTQLQFKQFMQRLDITEISDLLFSSKLQQKGADAICFAFFSPLKSLLCKTLNKYISGC